VDGKTSQAQPPSDARPGRSAGRLSRYFFAAFAAPSRPPSHSLRNSASLPVSRRRSGPAGEVCSLADPAAACRRSRSAGSIRRANTTGSRLPASFAPRLSGLRRRRAAFPSLLVGRLRRISAAAVPRFFGRARGFARLRQLCVHDVLAGSISPTPARGQRATKAAAYHYGDCREKKGES